jgi:dienelactone hydrolase
MQRRDVLRWLGTSGIAGILPGQVSGQDPAPYVEKGSGPPLIVFDRGAGYYDGLADRYRVVVMDYPPQSIRESQSQTVIDSFTPDRVCADVLAVADKAGADRFAFYGFSWGAVVGLQLATRTNRLTALVCGGWPPLGAPYKDMTNETRRQGQQQIYTTFYRRLETWPEREAVSKISCPRMTFAGTDDVITTPAVTARIGPLIAEHRDELQRMGWSVRLVDGFKHDLGSRPDVVVPLLREFLDPLLLRV